MTENPKEPRIFTDADLEALIDLFFMRIQREMGRGILKAVWVAFLGACVSAMAVGLLLKYRVFIGGEGH